MEYIVMFIAVLVGCWDERDDYEILFGYKMPERCESIQ